MFHVYIVRCADGSYDTGQTDELEARMAAHHDGTFHGYTSQRLPVRLVWTESFATREEALAAEVQIKRWSRAKKEALIRGDWDGLRKLARNHAAGEPDA